MKKIIMILMLGLSGSLFAQNDAEAEAAAVFEEFLIAFSSWDFDTVVGLFSEDALVWTAESQTLLTTHSEIERYFNPVGVYPPEKPMARAIKYESVEIATNLVAISGMWERVPSGQSEGTPLRVSMVLALRNGAWKIIQFHNSAVPQ